MQAELVAAAVTATHVMFTTDNLSACCRPVSLDQTSLTTEYAAQKAQGSLPAFQASCISCPQPLHGLATLPFKLFGLHTAVIVSDKETIDTKNS